MNSQDETGVNSRILSTFLNELDGIQGGSAGAGVVVVVTCRLFDSLDEALVRPGRLQHHIHLSYPSTEDVQAIISARLGPARDEIAQIRQGCMEAGDGLVTCADVDGLCQLAVRSQLREKILKEIK